jgi:hypothetical protein
MVQQMRLEVLFLQACFRFILGNLHQYSIFFAMAAKPKTRNTDLQCAKVARTLAASERQPETENPICAAD